MASNSKYIAWERNDWPPSGGNVICDPQICSFRHPEIERVGKIFEANMNSVAFVPTVIMQAYGLGMKWGLSGVAAVLDVFGSLENYEKNKTDNALNEKLNPLLRELADGKKSFPPPIHLGMFDFQCFEHMERECHTSFESIMYSQIVAAWAIFEVMAGDLWRVAVGLDDKLLLKAASHIRKKREKKDAKPLVPAPMTVEQVRGHFPMVKLRLIQNAYDALSISPQISGIIHGNEFHHLSIVRNVIVHNAGRVDSVFLNQVANLKSSPLANLKLSIGDPFPVCGVMVRDLVYPAMLAGTKLIWTLDRLI